MCPVLSDQSPAYASISGHGSGAVNRLHFPEGSLVVFDEVIAIQNYGKGTTRVENDVNDLVVSTLREKWLWPQSLGRSQSVACMWEWRARDRRQSSERRQSVRMEGRITGQEGKCDCERPCGGLMLMKRHVYGVESVVVREGWTLRR